ncbi:unnamed protein product, partial [Strongylus vulgaris]
WFSSPTFLSLQIPAYPHWSPYLKAVENGILEILSTKIVKPSQNPEDEKLMKSARYLAKIEYDWLATVIERCTFLLFLLVFLFVSLGINFVGFIHWTYSEPPAHAVPVFLHSGL